MLEQRERIIRAFEDTYEDYLMVADTTGVNRSTARSIVARYISEGRIAERPCGGANNVRVDNEMKDCLNDVLNDNCMLPLAQINQELRRRLPRKPRIYDGTVARTLDGMLFRFKIATISDKRSSGTHKKVPTIDFSIYISVSNSPPAPPPRTMLLLGR